MIEKLKMDKFQFTKKNAVATLILLLIVISLVKPSILKNMKNHVLGRLLLLFILILFEKESNYYYKFIRMISNCSKNIVENSKKK